MKILTSNDDDFLYERILELLEQIKLVQGGASIAPTLRRHKVIKDYLIEKQKAKINFIEDSYFTDGGINQFAIEIRNTLPLFRKKVVDFGDVMEFNIDKLSRYG